MWSGPNSGTMWQSPGGTAEYHEKPQSRWAVSKRTLEPRTSCVQRR